jgi:hypothetical protein
MPMTTLTSREFNQYTDRAKKAALRGPVVITDRGIVLRAPAAGSRSAMLPDDHAQGRSCISCSIG